MSKTSLTIIILIMAMIIVVIGALFISSFMGFEQVLAPEGNINP